MCGIYCSITLCNDKEKSKNISTITDAILKNRGPDLSNVLCVDESLIFGGFVLWHQGMEICPQPCNNLDIILLFNGDIFNIDNTKSTEMSDTAWLASQLYKCIDDDEICKVFKNIEGPFSCIFYNKKTKCIYFGRDSLGRNSLIIEHGSNNLCILSTSHFRSENEFQVMEIPSLGLYKIDLAKPHNFFIFPWSNPDEFCMEQVHRIESTFPITVKIQTTINPLWLNTRNTSQATFNFYDLCDSRTPCCDLFEQLLKNKELQKELDRFSILLENSVKNRVKKSIKSCKNCVLHGQECKHSKISILFSGGIDCSILAVLADKFVDKDDSIDLINVAFEKINTLGDTDWNVPDRCSAKLSYIELLKICPTRKWNLVEVNISREELCSTLCSHIKHLICPLTTVLDESLGCSFWFASRGNGICRDEVYHSPARVAIVGSGADELFGGYTRHRNAYLRYSGDELGKQENVLAELEMDWRRISSRNLARDDRVVADNGKTARAPFIEESIVKYVRGLKPSQRSCYLLKEGVGDKLFLRIFGYRLGLKCVAFLKKRAIQFGSRIANKAQKAADPSVNLNFSS